MSKKTVQIRLEPELHKSAKVGLAKLEQSFQEFLEEYIRLKFSKEKKRERKKE
jgi:hypothetical protein